MSTHRPTARDRRSALLALLDDEEQLIAEVPASPVINESSTRSLQVAVELEASTARLSPSSTTAECPVCFHQLSADVDVLNKHIDACLTGFANDVQSLVSGSTTSESALALSKSADASSSADSAGRSPAVMQSIGSISIPSSPSQHDLSAMWAAPARRQRLTALSSQHNVPLLPPVPKTRRTEALPAATVSHIAAAKDLIIRRRSDDPEYRKKLFGQDEVNAKEASRALKAVIEEGGDLATINALLSLGADVNFARRASSSMIKKLSNKDQEDRRSDVLITAVRTSQVEVVQLLAEKADRTAIQEALPYALRQDSLDIVQCLLSKGGDPSNLHEEFLSAVSAQRNELVELLLLAPKRPCSSCLYKASVISVLSGSLRICSAVFLTGADSNHRDAEALRSSINATRVDLVLAICNARLPPSQDNLDKSVQLAYNLRPGSWKSKSLMIEILVCAGAQGPLTSGVLYSACKADQRELVQAMTSFGVSTDHNSGETLKYAIQNAQPELLRILLHSRPRRSTVDDVIKSMAKTLANRSKESLQCIDALRSVGASSEALMELLLSVLDELKARFEGSDPFLKSSDEDLKLVESLAKCGLANRVSQASYAIRVAVGGPLDILDTLLGLKLPPLAIDDALPTIQALPYTAQIKEQIIQMALSAGARGTHLDECLITYAQAQSGGVRKSQQILANVSVDYKDGKALHVALTNGNIDLFRLLLGAHPSHVTLDRLWDAACKLNDLGVRQAAFSELIKIDKRVESLERTLVTAVQHAALAPSQFHASCELLLDANITEEAVSTALATLVMMGDMWLSPETLSIVQLLLSRGASGPFLELALLEAFSMTELDAVNLLSRAVQDTEVFTTAFDNLVLDHPEGKSWEAEVDVIELAVDCGVAAESLSLALINTLDEFDKGGVPTGLVNLFLYNGADVNYEGGMALKTAAHHGDVHMVRKLLGFGPSLDTVNQALFHALMAGHEEQDVLDLIETFSAAELLNVNYVYPDEDPLIFTALMMYPGSVAIIERLIDLGANLETHVETAVYEEWTEGNEPPLELVTVLSWTLTQREDRVSDEVIQLLIKKKANVNALTPDTNSSALILAANFGRDAIVRSLLKAGANPAFKNSYGDSALCYASHLGNLKAVTYLIKGGAPVDDGSLHEAVRRKHPEVVKALIRSGHNPDYTSTRHQGRTALGELCLLGDATERKNELEAVLTALVKAKVDPFKRWQGKTMLFLVLDNIIDPVGMLDKLIERVFNQVINDERNLVIDGDYSYSPTMYIKKKVFQAPESLGEALLELLVQHSAVDRYFAKERLEQPDDKCGMPDQIEKYERKKQDRLEKLEQKEQDLQMELQRNALLAEQKYDQNEVFHKQALQHKDQALEQRIYALHMTSQVKQDIAWKEDQQKQAIAQADREKQLAFKREQHQLKMHNMSTEQRAKLAFNKQIDHQKLTTQKKSNIMKAAANKDSLKTTEKTNKSNMSFKKASMAMQRDSHKMKMSELKLKGKESRQSSQMKIKEIRAQHGKSSGSTLGSVAGFVGKNVLKYGVKLALAPHTAGLSMLL